MPEFACFFGLIGPVMICGVPVAAIAEPQSVWWPGVGLGKVPVDSGTLPPAGYGPAELFADPAD